MPIHTIPSRREDLAALLSPDERAHSERLLALIRAEITRAGGWLDFESFMKLALYAPGLGYYSVGTHKLGEGGDFTTAPEISPLFGRCLALQCAQVLQHLGTGSVLELGAGSGVMALQILRELEQVNCLPQTYCILEVSGDLRLRQQVLLREQLPHLVERVRWLDSLPEEFVGVVLANEVLDALPVQRFVFKDGEIRALGVTHVEGRLVWQTHPPGDALRAAVESIPEEVRAEWPDNYCSEVNPALPGWLRALSDTVRRGVLLFVDYGMPQRQYYSAERTQGTLSCFFRQRMHDNPLINVGVQDITAWVDFTAVAEAGVAAGLELQGFATQAHFLFGCGLERLLADMSNSPDETRWQLSQQIQKLTLPGEMGESFKAMAFARDCEVELGGFAFRDLRDRL